MVWRNDNDNRIMVIKTRSNNELKFPSSPVILRLRPIPKP